MINLRFQNGTLNLSSMWMIKYRVFIEQEYINNLVLEDYEKIKN